LPHKSNRCSHFWSVRSGPEWLYPLLRPGLKLLRVALQSRVGSLMTLLLHPEYNLERLRSLLRPGPDWLWVILWSRAEAYQLHYSAWSMAQSGFDRCSDLDQSSSGWYSGAEREACQLHYTIRSTTRSYFGPCSGCGKNVCTIQRSSEG
jgi:hypothetical protein